MRKLVATVAAGLMIAGGAVLSAPAATAYPAGFDPAVRIIGSAGLNPGDLSGARAFYYTPGCTATMKITRAGSNAQIVERTRNVVANGTATFAFRAPARPGLYNVKVKQDKEPGCAGFSDTAQFRVLR